MGPQEILGVAAALGLLIVLSGSWLLMRSLRTKSSRLLFTSVAALILWSFLSDAIYRAVFYYSDLSKQNAWESWIYLSLDVFVPVLLILSASTCFWLVARSLSRPNSSFKPSPLRESA